MPFVNEAERRVAEALNSLRVRWEYEPTLFVFERDDLGNCTHGFTPDFYLPRQDLYLEVTEQKILTPKNGKLRMLRTHYPDVRCALLTKKEVRDPELRRILLETVRKFRKPG